MQKFIGEEAFHNFQSRCYDNLTKSTIGVAGIVENIEEKMVKNIPIYVADDNSGVFCAGAPIQFVKG